MAILNESLDRTVGVVFSSYKGFTVFIDFFFTQLYIPEDPRFYFSSDSRRKSKEFEEKFGDNIVYCPLKTARLLVLNQDFAKVIESVPSHDPITSDEDLKKYGSPFFSIYVNKEKEIKY